MRESEWRKELTGSKFKINGWLTAEIRISFYFSKTWKWPNWATNILALKHHQKLAMFQVQECARIQERSNIVNFAKNVPRCECGFSWVVKCPNPTTQQIFKDLPIYFPHYKNGCLEMFLQAGWIITRRSTGTCVYISKSFALYLLCNVKIVFNNVIEHLKLETLGSQKVSKLSLESHHLEQLE